MKKTILKRILALLLCLCLLGTLSTAALAAGADRSPLPEDGTKAAPITYLDGNDQSHTITNYEVVTSSTRHLTNTFWVVTESLTLNDRITTDTYPHLILCDGVTLTVPKGIQVQGATRLRIYAQSRGENAGALVINGVENQNAGIGSNAVNPCGTISIEGGRITVTGSGGGAAIGSGSSGSGGSITIHRGEVTATGGDYGAAIGGGRNSDGGTVTIHNGKVTAIGGSYAAGIGGGNSGGGEVIIDGGDLTVQGGSSGAGIGGGNAGSASVKISGGTVNATGGASGAGIGSGSEGTESTVLISGGTVTAAGGKFGAGVGCGANGSGGTITVSGGTVTATGDNSGAGIGGGYESDGGTVTISGGTVTATGGTAGAGIGGGLKGAGATLVVTGGKTTANNGWNGSGIGGGRDNIESGSLTLCLKNNDDFLKAASYGGAFSVEDPYAPESTVWVQDEAGNRYTGILSGEQKSAAAGKKLTAPRTNVWVVDQTGSPEFYAYVFKAGTDTNDGTAWPGHLLTAKGPDFEGNAYYFLPSIDPRCDTVIFNNGTGAQNTDENALHLSELTENTAAVYNNSEWQVFIGEDIWAGEGEITTQPGCTEPGVRTLTGVVFGTPLTQTIEALGHDWDEGVVTTAPTYTYEGVRTFTCSRCGATRTEVIPMLEMVNPFVDVKEGKYYYEPVLWAVYHDPQITNGTDDTHFSPNKTCTRGQVVTFLWRAYGCPEPTITEHSFTDVKSGAYYFTAMLWAVENQITSGTSATTFSPNKECTRAQVVTFLWRADGEPEPESDECPFTDVRPTASYRKAVLWAVENGITNGTTATTFSPNKTCTRGQVVTFLYHALAE